MNVTMKKILLVVLSVLLVAEIGLVFVLGSRKDSTPVETAAPTVPAATELLPTEATEAPTETAAPTETTAPTEPPETEPKEKHYTLSFAGDCTLGSTKANWSNPNHFIQTIGEDYDYPFANVRQFFENDDFTLINLEGPLTDSTSGAQSKTFAFRGPTAYTQIMTGSSVEAVTLANNHAEDYGKAGYESTTKALGDAGIAYVEEDKTAMYTTESGLKIGLYADAFNLTAGDIKKNISQLRSDGAEIVICAFHWGEEGVYRPDGTQQKFAKAAIDAGADVVYGHHPHVLQPIEQYNGGYIFYSMGNFSFGGAALPQDYDTVLLQLDVIRDENGKVSLGDLTAIPCSYKNAAGHNSFQPTPLEEGADYDRIMKKLGGSFTGGNLKVDYSKLDPKPETPAPDTGSSSGGSTDTGSSSGGSADTGASSGGSADTGASSGGSADTGASSGGSADTGASSGGSADTGASSGGSADTGASSGGSADTGASSGGSADTGASSGGGDSTAE